MLKISLSFNQWASVLLATSIGAGVLSSYVTKSFSARRIHSLEEDVGELALFKKNYQEVFDDVLLSASDLDQRNMALEGQAQLDRIALGFLREDYTDLLAQDEAFEEKYVSLQTCYLQMRRKYKDFSRRTELAEAQLRAHQRDFSKTPIGELVAIAEFQRKAALLHCSNYDADQAFSFMYDSVDGDDVVEKQYAGLEIFRAMQEQGVLLLVEPWLSLGKKFPDYRGATMVYHPHEFGDFSGVVVFRGDLMSREQSYSVLHDWFVKEQLNKSRIAVMFADYNEEVVTGYVKVNPTTFEYQAVSTKGVDLKPRLPTFFPDCEFK